MANEAAQQLALLDQRRDEFLGRSSLGRGQPGRDTVPGTGFGLIDAFTVKSRRREFTERQIGGEKQQAAKETTRGANLLQQNLDVITSPEQGREFLTGLSDPGTRETTLKRMTALRAEQRAESSAGQSGIDGDGRKQVLEMELLQSKVDKAFTDDQRAEFEFGVRQKMSPTEQAITRQQLTNAQLTGQAGQRTLDLIPEQVAVMNPITGVPANVNITGSVYEKNQTASDALQRGLTKVNEMIGLIQEFNTEVGGVAGTRMSQLSFGIIVGANQAAGAGAPTGTELEEVAKGLRDPTGFLNNLLSIPLNLIPGGVARQKEALISGYQQYAKDISLALKQQIAINPAIVNVDFGLFDPGVWDNNDERAFFEANSGRNWLEGQQ